jgi:HAD superfamily hydrolase (TIGR01458 family)
MSTIRGVLIDLSGTIHIGAKAIPGAVKCIERLRHSGRQIRFLTNTSVKSSDTLLQELRTMGIAIDKEEEECLLMTSVLATKKYLIQNTLKPFCLMEDTSDFDGVDLAQPHNCVVVGLAPSKFNYKDMNQAYRILLRSPKLIAIHRANYMQDVDEELSLGPGGFVTALESAANCTACVMGKPSNEFFQSAMWPDIAAEETCMIGDDIVGDIQGAKDAGIGTTILVRTGKYRTGDEEKSAPTAICDSIVQAVDYILAMDNNNNNNK